MYYKFPNEFIFEVDKRDDLDIIEGVRCDSYSKQREIEREIDEEYARGVEA